MASAAPVVPDANPFLGLKAAVDRHDHAGNPLGDNQAISNYEAVFSYTMGGAILSGDDHVIGSLTPGKWADMIILNGDPLTASAENLLELTIQETYVAGTLVYAK